MNLLPRSKKSKKKKKSSETESSGDDSDADSEPSEPVWTERKSKIILHIVSSPSERFLNFCVYGIIWCPCIV